MTLNSKWILDASPADAVHAVAVRTIEARLAAVRHHLPLAAEKPDENVEHVHQLRVATRRNVAALDVYRKLFPKEPRKALCRQLKAVRRAAGRARDFDVLLLRQFPNSDDPLARQFLDDIRRKRGEAQQPLREIHASLAETNQWDSLTRRMCAVDGGESVAGRSSPFGSWAHTQLQKTVKAFFAAEPRLLNDLDALHAFRIRGKELRYAMELLVAAFPASFHTRLYPLIERLQDRLGAINDHAVALQRFRSWSTETADPALRKYLQTLLKKERRELRKSTFRFACWWTPGRSKHVHQRFRKLMENT